MAKVVWTDKAIADVVAIVDWISADRPRAAIRVAEKLKKAGDGLDAFYGRGRLISPDRRELVVVQPYLIRYRVEADRIMILEVRHAARNAD